MQQFRIDCVEKISVNIKILHLFSFLNFNIGQGALIHILEKMSTSIEPAFVGCGKIAGVIETWRIESLKPVKLDSKTVENN